MPDYLIVNTNITTHPPIISSGAPGVTVSAFRELDNLRAVSEFGTGASESRDPYWSD